MIDKIPILNGGQTQKKAKSGGYQFGSNGRDLAFNIAGAKKIRCPRHFMLKPGADPFIREKNPAMSGVSQKAVDLYGVKKTRIKLDRNGNKIRNRASFFQPQITASFAIHQIYDPKNPVCIMCKGRCVHVRGQGPIDIRATTKKRLVHG